MKTTQHVITEMTSQEKAAYITAEIIQGREPTTAEIAEKTGMTRQGAHKMMGRISRVIPVYQHGGRWRSCP